MKCSCGGQKVVKLVEHVAVVMCSDCDRGEFVPQPKMQEVYDFRARVQHLMEQGGFNATV